MPYQLAQVNVACLRAALSDPSMSDFVGRIDAMNALAESSRGFVWRYSSANGQTDELQIFEKYFDPFDQDRFFFNMSVWESVEDLQHYVYDTDHIELLRAKKRWILPFDKKHLALWWVPTGQRLTVHDAYLRLASFQVNGPTPYAFSWQFIYPKPDL